MIIADTNLVAHALIPGPGREEARAVLRKDAEWAAPLLWRSELRNVLALYVRRKEMTLDAATLVMREAESLMRGREYQVPSADVLSLAAASGCSAYDCEFVALARDLGVPLVTSDRAILRAFPRLARSLREFAGK
jgi:predicted nucleic acid-binding protein